MKNKPKNIPSPYKFAGTKIFRDTTALPFADGGPLHDRDINGKLLNSTYASVLGNMFREGGPFGEDHGVADYATSIYASQPGNYYNNGGMIKRADGSYSQRGLWDNIRAATGSGKKPTKEMLAQEKKINKEYKKGGPINISGPRNIIKPEIAPQGTEISPDYDLRRFYIENPMNAERFMAGQGHATDEYKLPNHPTFSDHTNWADGSVTHGSLYSTIENPGGEWVQKQDGTWHFNTSYINRNNMSEEELQRYFNETEPGNTIKYKTGGQFPIPYSLPEDSYRQGGRNLHNSIYSSSMAQYPATYKYGGTTDPPKKGLITYKDNADLIDSTGNFDAISKVNISPEYNDQIKQRLYTGNYGFDPNTGQLVKLTKAQRATISDDVKKIRAQEEDVKAYNKSVEEAGGVDPRMLNPKTTWSDKQREDFIKQGFEATVNNPVFNTATYFTPVGAAIGGLEGIANLVPDLYEKDYTNTAFDMLGTLPFLPKGFNKLKKSNILNNAAYIPNDYSDNVLKAGFDGNLITRPLTPLGKNELTPGEHWYRKIGNEAGLKDLIKQQGAKAPAPMMMKSGVTLDAPFFGRGKAPNENYKGLYAVELKPEARPKYSLKSHVAGVQNYGAVPFTEEGLVQNLPLEDLNVYRKKWFSNNYKQLDPNNLEKGLKNAALQRNLENIYKWGVRGYLGKSIYDNVNKPDTTQYKYGGSFEMPRQQMYMPLDNVERYGGMQNNMYRKGGSVFYATNTPQLEGEGKDLTYPENSYVYKAGGGIKIMKTSDLFPYGFNLPNK